MVLALALGILPHLAVFAAAYCTLRAVSFGVHLQSSILCTVASLVYYLGSIVLSRFVEIPWPVKCVTLAVCMGLFFLYAPAQTKKRPIPQSQRKRMKVRSVIVLALVSVAVLLLADYPVYSNLLFMGAVCQTINLLPITFKLYKEC